MRAFEYSATKKSLQLRNYLLSLASHNDFDELISLTFPVAVGGYQSRQRGTVVSQHSAIAPLPLEMQHVFPQHCQGMYYGHGPQRPVALLREHRIRLFF